MGWWLLNADTLARSRFVVSPLAETTAALLTLEHGPAEHPAARAWVERHRPAYRARLAADPVTAALLRAAFTARWNADFLTPAPIGDTAAFAGELARVRAAPPDVVRADLAVALGGGPLPAELADRTDLADRAADLLAWVWAETVEPDWARRRRILEADVVARTRQLGDGGWAAALDDLRPGMRWLGEGRLQINAHDNPPRRISGARMLFVPVTFRQGWACWDEPRLYALVYPCTGVLAGAADRPGPAPLAALLGPARATVLTLLDTPKSTTVLVALTGQVLGSTGRHLRVLRDAGLVDRRRAGRSVLYYRTEAGEVLVRAAGGAP
ncbi:transcriptional regulator [Streptomyces sp. NPDC060194]|uniref:ArsR/SmtB family transcription factor n=1 Tax=Streptomyces sp. NPDC060194 TaxID=3347069 RepID=UPI003667E287